MSDLNRVGIILLCAANMFFCFAVTLDEMDDRSRGVSVSMILFMAGCVLWLLKS